MIESSRLPFRKHVCHTVPLIPTICFSSEGGLAMMAPKARKLLSADALFGMLRTGFADIADHRPGDTDISLTDALMSAFALFSLKSPSLLAFDKERTEGNLHRVYGIERVPCEVLSQFSFEVIWSMISPHDSGDTSEGERRWR